MYTPPNDSRKPQKIAAACAAALLALCSTALAGDQEDADALFAAEQWADAAGAYETLLQADSEHAGNWFNLGQARHQLENYKGAREAYRKAIDAGYQPAVRARLHLARALMSLRDRKGALKELEKIAKSGGPNFRTIQGMKEFQPLAREPRFISVIEALKPCNTEEYRQFDFWLGKWDVTSAGSTKPAASNEISSRHNGCVVLEQYAAGAFTGMSINFYDASAQKWHQTWMSNAGGALYIEGGLNDKGEMALSDAELPSSAVSGKINKITWTPNSDGSVRQFWQTSGDGGETWSIAFDGLYTKAEPAE